MTDAELKELESRKRMLQFLESQLVYVTSERDRLRHDLEACADKLATASFHIGLVALRQPERFWTRTHPTVPGWFWYREEEGTGGIMLVHDATVVHCGRIKSVGDLPGWWSGPIQPPTLVAPE